MRFHRKTISAIVGIEGVALHSGVYTKIELHPAEPGSGIHFVRTDLGDLRVPALQSSTTALDYATSVGKDDVSIGTVEHLLSAIVAFGVTDIDIRIDGPEVPIIDGSALPFVHLIDAAGIKELADELTPIRIRETIEVHENGKSIRIEPAEHLAIRYKIEFPHPSIGKQTFFSEIDRETFVRKIAPARTFGFLREVEKMRAAGLARGGSVENCIVLDDESVTNGPLRLRDEFVRHKVLDLIGDLALLGRPLLGEITASKAGHALHSRFVAEILRQHEGEDADEARREERRPAFEMA